MRAVVVRVAFLKSLCTYPTAVEKNILETKLRFNDYQNADLKKAVSDFTKLTQQYEVASKNGHDTKRCSYIETAIVGRQLNLNDIQGCVQRKAVGYLLNSLVMSRGIYLM